MSIEARCVIVSNIPGRFTKDKVTIHFQTRRVSGGGDVRDVLFPWKPDQPDTAVVVFYDIEDAENVLKISQQRMCMTDDVTGERHVAEVICNPFPQGIGQVSTKIARSLVELLGIDVVIQYLPEIHRSCPDLTFNCHQGACEVKCRATTLVIVEEKLMKECRKRFPDDVLAIDTPPAIFGLDSKGMNDLGGRQSYLATYRIPSQTSRTDGSVSLTTPSEKQADYNMARMDSRNLAESGTGDEMMKSWPRSKEKNIEDLAGSHDNGPCSLQPQHEGTNDIRRHLSVQTANFSIPQHPAQSPAEAPLAQRIPDTRKELTSGAVIGGDSPSAVREDGKGGKAGLDLTTDPGEIETCIVGVTSHQMASAEAEIKLVMENFPGVEVNFKEFSVELTGHKDKLEDVAMPFVIVCRSQPMHVRGNSCQRQLKMKAV